MRERERERERERDSGRQISACCHPVEVHTSYLIHVTPGWIINDPPLLLETAAGADVPIGTRSSHQQCLGALHQRRAFCLDSRAPPLCKWTARSYFTLSHLTDTPKSAILSLWE